MSTQAAQHTNVRQSIWYSIRQRIHDFLLASWFLPMCLLFAAGIRALWITLIPAAPVDDAAWYVARAIGLAQGHGYVIDGRPTAYWPVGYPAFLALVFSLSQPALLIGKFANLLLYLGVIVLMYRAAVILFASRLTGRLVVLLLSIYPNHIAYTGLLTSEILFTFLLCAGCVLHITLHRQPHWVYAVLAGACFGLATFVRPQVVLLPVALEAFMYLIQRCERRSVRTLIIVYAVITLVLLPWFVRNYQTFNHVIFVSTNGGVNLFIGNNPTATGRYYWPDNIQQATAGATNEYEFDIRARAAALDYIRSHPWATISLWPRKLFYIYRADTSGVTWNSMGISAEAHFLTQILTVFRVIAQAYYVAIITLVLGFFLTQRKRLLAQPLALYGLCISIYFTLMYVVFFGENRYQFQNMPWLMMYAAALIATYIHPNKRTDIRLPRGM